MTLKNLSLLKKNYSEKMVHTKVTMVFGWVTYDRNIGNIARINYSENIKLFWMTDFLGGVAMGPDFSIIQDDYRVHAS